MHRRQNIVYFVDRLNQALAINNAGSSRCRSFRLTLESYPEKCNASGDRNVGYDVLLLATGERAGSIRDAFVTSMLWTSGAFSSLAFVFSMKVFYPSTVQINVL